MTRTAQQIELAPASKEDSLLLNGMGGLFLLLWISRLGLASLGVGATGLFEVLLWASIGIGVLALLGKGTLRNISLFIVSAIWGGILLQKWYVGGMQFPYLPEHAIAVGLPIAWAIGAGNSVRAYKLMGILLALTFLGHGLYALGWPEPQPAHFLWMTSEILGISASSARMFLIVAGIMDLVVVIGIFARGDFRKMALWYAFFWGILTALARPLAYVEMESFGVDMMRWLPEMLIRIPHGGVAALLLLNKRI